MLKRKKPSIPLRRGSAIHRGLELGMYKMEEFMQELEEEYYSLPSKYQEELGDNFISDIELILKNYFYLIDNGYLEELGTVEKEVKIEAKLGANLSYIGYIDGIVKRGDDLYVLERKTYSASPPTELELVHTQTALYELLHEANFKGVIFEYIKSKPPKFPKKLKSGKYSVAQTALNSVTPYTISECSNDIPQEYLDAMENNIDSYVIRKEYQFNHGKNKNLFNNFLYVARELRRKENAKNPKFFRNIGLMSCRMCEFKELCHAELSNADTTYIIDENYEKRETHA